MSRMLAPACSTLGVASCLLGHGVAAAADQFQVSTGGQIDFADYGFVGLTAALPGSAIGSGFAVRASGVGGDYSYVSGVRKIDGVFSGGEVDGVYEISGPNAWLDLVGGARYADTVLTPFDPGNRRHGRQVEGVVGADGGAVTGPWRVDYYGEYGTRLEDYSVRVSLTHTVNTRLRAGVELSAEGDPTYDLQRFGPSFGITLDSRSELQLATGASRQSGEGTGAFLRVLITRRF